MEDKIMVSNTQAMAVLLEALGLRKYEWTPSASGIELNITVMELTYAINNSSESIQHIFGTTPEWLELTQIYGKHK